MIRSMTGFGEAGKTVDGVHHAIEIRSLNNRFFKAAIRLPDEIQGLEAEIEPMLRQRLTRGSITLTARFSDPTANAAANINVEALQTYIERIRSLSLDAARGGTLTLDIGALLSLPGVLQPPADFDRQLDRLRPVVKQLVHDSCDKLIEMRESEGSRLLADLHQHRESVQHRLELIRQRAPVVVEDYNQRLRERVERMLEDVGTIISETDLIREVAIYADRSDISEEIARLTGHLAQFRDLVDATPCEPVGRTLDFLAQEMLREANTIASKCNDAQISREIVEIKGAIDRIKEQVQNVE